MVDRLQKILSQRGIASRRQAEQLILDGRVRLNGAIATLGQTADPECDRIEVDGRSIQARPDALYLLLNKPLGVVSTCHDPEGRPTVLDLLPSQYRVGLHPVGRLDIDSSGALLLTNDGTLTFYLTHPRHAIPKTYRVWVEGSPTPQIVEKWRTGVWLDGKKTLPVGIRILNRHHPTQTCLEIEMREGRNRQIRRVAEQLGHPVASLHRVAIGSVQLESLQRGQYRILDNAEIQVLNAQTAGIKQPLPNLGIGERVISEAT